MLQGREEGERRLRALVEIGTISLEAIKGTPGLGVPHDDSTVIVTQKPSCGRGDPVHPTSVAVHGFGAGTGIGECRHLNGLLVKTRTMVSRTTASDRGDREMAVSRLAVE